MKKYTGSLFAYLLISTTPVAFSYIQLNLPEEPDLGSIWGFKPIRGRKASENPYQMRAEIHNNLLGSMDAIREILQEDDDLETMYTKLNEEIKEIEQYQEKARKYGQLVDWAKLLDYADKCSEQLQKTKTKKDSSLAQNT